MMQRRLLLGAAIAAALGLSAARFGATTARADDAPAAPTTAPSVMVDSLKVAVASPANIFKQMKETQDVIAKMESDTKALAAEQEQRHEAIESLQKDMQIYKPGTPDYESKEKDLMQKSIEYDVWVQVTGKELQQRQKSEMKQLFDKIQEAIGKVAKDDGIDLVIADQGAQLPDDLEKLSVDQVRDLITQRTILYSDGKNDLDNDVLTKLDKEYEDSK